MSSEQPPVDPFNEDDPAARERERRRLEREAKRRQRDNRASLASRVGGLLDGAASKGREKIEQTRERAKDPAPPAQGAEPPAFRRAPAPADPAPTPLDSAPAPAPADHAPASASAPAPAQPSSALPSEEEVFGSAPLSPSAQAAAAPDESRLSAEALMPRRPSRRRPLDTEDVEAVPPEPVAPGPRRDGASEEWAAAAPADGSGSGARPPRRRPGSVGGWTLWRRRAMALVAVVLLAAGAAFALSKVGGDDPAPVTKSKPVKTTDVTIPEGLTMDDMASIAKKAGLKGDYEEAAKQAIKRFNPSRYGAPKDASLEGFLFPATYELEQGAPVSDLVDKQLEAFDQYFHQVNLSYAKKKNLTPYDVVIIASMIEKEVQVPDERSKVSAVIYNRLNQGMPLEIDATVRYALGNDYEHSLTTDDLQTDSPYNTYVNPGLPKGPIANPGLDSLKAAAKPSNDDYLYYVVKPGTCGEHTFTDNYDEFVQASQEYDAAQAAAGGSPTDC